MERYLSTYTFTNFRVNFIEGIVAGEEKKLTYMEELIQCLKDDKTYARYALPARCLRHILPLDQARNQDYVFIAVEREIFNYLFPNQDVDEIFLRDVKIPAKAKLTIVEAVLVKDGKEYNIPASN